MATKAYVVSEGHFSYDDNYYSSTEGGNPNKVFLEKEQAEEYAEEQSLKIFKTLVLQNEIFNYGWGDIEGVFKVDDEFENLIQEKFKNTPEDWWDQGRYNESEEKVSLSEEEWKKFYSFCTLQFFYVNEVGFGDVFS